MTDMRRRLRFSVAGLLLAATAASAQQAPPVKDLAPIATWPLEVECETPRWFLDVVSYRAARPKDGPASREIDFTGHVLLAVPCPSASGQRLLWGRAERRDEAWHASLVLAPAEPMPADERVPASEPPRPLEPGAMFLLPRLDVPLVLHLPGTAHCTVPPPDNPARGETIKVLALHDLAGGGGEAPKCRRATSAAEWRELQVAIGESATAVDLAGLDFARYTVVWLAPEPARAFPGFHVRTATEEGVDVVTVTQSFPSGRELPQRSPSTLLVLPRRPRQLSIVLGGGFASPRDERTVATFDPP